MKKLVPKLLLCFCILFCGSLSAQNVRGRVLDATAHPLPYTAVMLYSCDSVFLQGGVTDSLGCFAIQYNGSFPYLVKIKHIEYKEVTKQFHGLDCGDIVLDGEDRLLSEVVVQGKRPPVSLEKSGGLVYSADLIRQTSVVSTAYDVLKKLPGIIEQGDELSLVGSSDVLVVINGKLSNLSAAQLYKLLRSLPASRVEQLKVFYNPPPKYRTRAVVIDVVLTQAIKFEGEAHTSYSFGSKETHVWSVGGSAVLPLDAVSFDFSYDLGLSKFLSGIKYLSKHRLRDKIFEIDQQQLSRSTYRDHNIRLGAGFNLSENSSLEATYTGILNPVSASLSVSKGTFLFSENRTNNPDYTHDFSLRYQNNSGWDVNANYTLFHLNQRQHITNLRKEQNKEVFNVFSTQKINRLQLSADKQFSLSDKTSVTVGSSYSLSQSKDKIEYQLIEGKLDVSNSDLTQREYNFTLYTGVEQKFSDKFSASAYLTLEQYKRAGLNKRLLYPQASFTYAIAPDHLVQGSFSSEKVYPSFWSMQGVVSYIDGYSEVRGNPSLLPMQRYNGRLLYLYKQKYVVQFYHKYIDKYFQQSVYQDPNRLVLIYETKNWDYLRESGVNVVIPFSFTKHISHRLTTVLFNKSVKTKDFYGFGIDRNRWIWFAFLNNNFVLSTKPNVTFDLSVGYRTKGLQTVYDISPLWMFNLGLKYVSPSNRFSLSIEANDPFNISVPVATSQWGTQSFVLDTRGYNRSIEVRFSYNFGEYKKKERREVDTSRFGL